MLNRKVPMALLASALAISAAPGFEGGKGVNLNRIIPRAETGQRVNGSTLMEIFGIPSSTGGRGGGTSTSLNGRRHSGVARAKRAAKKRRNIRRRSAKRGDPSRIRRRRENRQNRALKIFKRIYMGPQA